MSKKKGISLIELVVAMAIFMIISTIAVGTFVTAIRMKTLTSTMKESQQKIRIALEMITRLSRQANEVNIQNNERDLVLRYLGSTPSATRFQLKPATRTLAGVSTPVYELHISDCARMATIGTGCYIWGENINLLGETFYLKTDSQFTKIVENSTPTLQIILNGRIVGMPSNPTNPYYNDQLSITTRVLLEGIK
jgi:type II secretory pathway pseudopilin PulG